MHQTHRVSTGCWVSPLSNKLHRLQGRPPSGRSGEESRARGLEAPLYRVFVKALKQVFSVHQKQPGITKDFIQLPPWYTFQ